MRQTTLVLVAAAALAACASAPEPARFGAFAEGLPPPAQLAITNDIVKKLSTVYPPAKSRLNLRHPSTGSFGSTLVSALRRQGYAFDEQAESTQASPGRKEAPSPESYRFAYVLDQPIGPDLYRVTLHINDQSLSRVYSAKNDGAAPAGAWVRKE